MRRAAQVDGNHAEIVTALRSVAGVSVCSLAGLGDGVPDLLVGARGLSYLCEVKDGEKTPKPSLVDTRSSAVGQTLDRERRDHLDEHRPGAIMGETNRRCAFNPRGLVWTG